MRSLVRCTLWLSLMVALEACRAAVGQSFRQLGPHEHGHGQFNMAIDGTRVLMELDIPGMDILGFEHKPSSPGEVAMMKKARAQLQSGLTLFVPASGAHCTAVSSKTEIATHHHEQDADHKGHDGEHDGPEHMGFHVEYTLECADPSKLDAIRFDFFKTFSATRVLQAVVIGRFGQKAYQVTPAHPVIDLPVK